MLSLSFRSQPPIHTYQCEYTIDSTYSSNMTISNTPAMARNPKYIVFTDWDGTVTLTDTNDHLTDNLGLGPERRRWLNIQILDGNWTFRDAFKSMLDSIDTSFDECVEMIKRDVKLDPGFEKFYYWAKANNIPVVIVSSGMKPIIYALLEHCLGKEAAEDIEIIANDTLVREDGSWDIIWRDDTDFGHDKSICLKPYNQLGENRPVLFYCGDGVSDVSAAKETDLLFAKQGRDLITYCEREDVKYTTFGGFRDIHKVVQGIVEGRGTIDEAIQDS